MVDLVIMKDQQAVTTSLNVSENFERNHRDVLKAIDEIKEGVAENYADLFWEDVYIHPQNKQPYRIIYMNRDGFTLLAMGFTGKKALEFKLKYIKAFNELETQIVNIPKDPFVALQLMFDATKQTKDEVEDVKNRVVNLEENTSIDPGKYSYIGRRISQKVRQVGKERDWTMSKERTTLLYKALNKEISEVSGVRTRSQLREKHFDNVMDLIDNWEPSTATRMIIHNLEDVEAFPIAEENKR